MDRSKDKEIWNRGLFRDISKVLIFFVGVVGDRVRLGFDYIYILLRSVDFL